MMSQKKIDMSIIHTGNKFLTIHTEYYYSEATIIRMVHQIII